MVFLNEGFPYTICNFLLKMKNTINNFGKYLRLEMVFGTVPVRRIVIGFYAEITLLVIFLSYGNLGYFPLSMLPT